MGRGGWVRRMLMIYLEEKSELCVDKVVIMLATRKYVA
jgi:hypothetical protein